MSVLSPTWELCRATWRFRNYRCCHHPFRGGWQHHIDGPRHIQQQLVALCTTAGRSPPCKFTWAGTIGLIEKSLPDVKFIKCPK